MLQGYFGTECNEKLIQSFFLYFLRQKHSKVEIRATGKLFLFTERRYDEKGPLEKKQQHHNVNLHQ